MDARERFEWEVDIVRGAGGFAPTTADLRALGEARFWEAVSRSAENDPMRALEERIEANKMTIAFYFDLRDDPDVRAALRESARAIRADRKSLSDS
jgi:hypothetical protein